jgi:integrase
MSSRYLRDGIIWYSAMKDGKRIRCSLETSNVAEAKIRQAQKDLELSVTGTSRKDASISEALDIYIEEKKFRRVPSVNQDSKRKIKAFIDEQGLCRVQDVTVQKMESHLNSILTSGRSEWSASNSLEYNRIFMKWCVDRGFLNVNPLSAIKKYKPVSKTIRYLTSKEIKKVLEIAEKESIYPAVATAIYTGLRKSEIFTLTPEDIDLKAGIIHIRIKDGFKPKGRENRVVGINDRLKAVLRHVQPRDGRMFDITNNVRKINRITRLAGVPWAGWHTFRHSFASEMIRQGVDVYTVSKVLGHKSVSITEKTYLHGSPEHQRKAVNKLSF